MRSRSQRVSRRGTHVVHRFGKQVTLLAGVLGVVLLGIVVPAGASTASGALAAGNTMCTDQTGSATGANLSGLVTTPWTTGGVTWTVLAARRPGVGETQVFKAENADITGMKVALTHSGTLYFRLCLANNTPSPIRFTNANVNPLGLANNSNTGPTTALLSNGGMICGERIAKSGHLWASSSAPVTWVVRAFNGGRPTRSARRLLTVTSMSVNQTFGPGRYAFLDVCAVDRSPGTNTGETAISMEFATA
jgi:hypothetical protein